MSQTASEQLGIDYSATGLKNILAGMKTLQQQVTTTGKAFDSLYKAVQASGNRGRSKSGGLLALTGPVAPGSLSVTSNGNASAHIGGNGQLRIDVRVAVGNGGNLAPAGPRNVTQSLGVSGPRQRRSALLAALQSGKLSPERYADTYDAYLRNEKRLKVSSPKSKLMTALMSTRFNIGHASPLVGRTLDALGVEAEAAAPPLLAVGAAAAAAKALYDLAHESVETANAFTRLSTSLGSGPGTTAQLSSFASAAGLSPDQAGSIAQRIQDRITSDPMAAAAGMRLGVYNLPGIYGNQDYGQQALTVIQHLRGIKDPNEQLRLARAVGAEDLLPAVKYMTNGDVNNLQSDAGVTGRVFGPQMSEDAERFQVAEGRVSQSIKNLAAVATEGTVEQLTSAFNGIANVFESISDWLNNNKGVIDFLTNGAISMIPGAGPLLSMGSMFDNHAKAVDDNTRATRENTQAMLQLGTYGRIDRDGSMPAGVNGQAIAQGNDINSMRLSTY